MVYEHNICIARGYWAGYASIEWNFKATVFCRPWNHIVALYSMSFNIPTSRKNNIVQKTIFSICDTCISWFLSGFNLYFDV